MNTKYLATRIASCLFGLLCLAGCTEQELPVTPPTGQGQGLCFAVKQTNTKMSYNNKSSYFEAGDTIGCVITVNDTYQANSAWHYNADNGMLILDYIWGTKQNQWYMSRISHNDNANNRLISRDNDPEGTTGFISLLREGTYNFYFYYPYIANDLIREDIYQAIDKYTEDNSTVFRELQYPNAATNSNLKYTNQWGGEETLTKNNWNSFATVNYISGEAYTENNAPRYNWQAFPCFANHTQASKAQINNSDFLWVRREDITSTSSQRVNLQFQKKMATIEVDSDIQLNDIYFVANKANTLLRGNIINLATGRLTAYDDPDPIYEPSVQKKNKYFKTDEHIIPCYRNQNIDEGINYYRIVLPYQPTFACNLCFTLEGKPYTIDLSTNIPSLEEGHLYTIHINQAGETTFDIVDWENDKFEILDPDTDLEDVPNP